MYIYPCEWNFRPDHCMYTSICKPAEERGISIVPGSLRFYDFEDLIAMLDSDKVKVVSTIGPERHSRSIDIDNFEIIQFLNNE